MSEQRTDPHGDNEHLVVLIKVPAEYDAAPIVATLAEHDIEASATGGYTANFVAEAFGDVQIKVMEKDLARAREVLATFERENASIDWSQVDVGTPEE